MSEDRLEAIRKDFEADPAVTLHPDAEWLMDEVERLREILVFADGAAVTGSGMALSDLYAKDCKWAQGVLSRAGCHPRGRKHRSLTGDDE